MSTTILLPFQPDTLTPAQLTAVSYLARYAGHTHDLYAYQLRRWFAWCETNGLDSAPNRHMPVRGPPAMPQITCAAAIRTCRGE
jgi:hypothetical protein